MSVLFAFAAGAPAAPYEPQSAALRQFANAAQDYVRLHRRIEAQLPRLGRAERAQEIFDSSSAIAAAIQTARAKAQECDILTPSIASVIRARIAVALESRGFLPEELIAASVEEADETAPMPSVNGRFPWLRGILIGDSTAMSRRGRFHLAVLL